MSEFIIATASTADMSAEYLQENEIPFISYTYMIDDVVYEDDCKEETKQQLYERMRQGEIVTTSMINTYTYYTFFKQLMEKGKDVIFLDMSREITKSYVNALEAEKQIKEEYPLQRFYMMDTRCISGGLGILLDNMVKLRDAGKSFDETILSNKIPNPPEMHRFTVDDLNYLKRGGRVSNAAALVGGLLSVKPVMYTSNEGKLVVAEKIRGRKSSLLAILEHMKKDFSEPAGKDVFIRHADCLEDAQFMRDKILETFDGVESVTITGLGTVIGAHCGPGLLTIFYLGSERFG